MPTTADRCHQLARTIAEHTDPAGCGECAAVNTLAGYLVALARQGMGAPVAEHALAQALRDLGVEP